MDTVLNILQIVVPIAAVLGVTYLGLIGYRDEDSAEEKADKHKKFKRAAVILSIAQLLIGFEFAPEDNIIVKALVYCHSIAILLAIWLKWK